MSSTDRIQAINGPVVTDKVETESYIPQIDFKYYTYGNYEKVLNIIESKKFFPIWITGLAGNGKTQMVEQACARAGIDPEYHSTDDQKKKTQILQDHSGKGREFIRVNFTMETDENDLIGGFRLDYLNTEDGADVGTVFHEGPVVQALRKGAVLLLDEIDVGHTNKIMCLQSVLEGKGVLIKATGEYVKPAPGFQIFATSNTKGRGSEDGTFIGTNIMNGAFLDRFAGTLFQAYPPPKIESNILKRYFLNYHWAERASENDISEDEYSHAATFVSDLCKWAKQIRETYYKGACEEVITTRSLINIIQGYSIFGDPELAIELSCERFDSATKESFVQMYKKLSGSAPKGSKQTGNEKNLEEEYVSL